MKDDKYYIYKYTNKLNGKIYIGQSKRIRQRIWEHMRCYEKQKSFLHDDIKKFGIENFDIDILEETTSKESSIRLERYYIEKYNSIYPNGYNQNLGGVGGFNARAVVCLELDGTFVKRYRSATDTEIDSFSHTEVLKCCKNIQRRVKDKMFMFEDDYIKNGAKQYTKPKSPREVSVAQCDKEGKLIKIYGSITKASSDTGIRRSSISGVLNGKNKSAGGYIFVYLKDYPIKNIETYKHIKRGRKIQQLDTNTGKIINEFDSISDAGKELNVNYKSIQRVVDLEGRTAYGYKWISA